MVRTITWAKLIKPQNQPLNMGMYKDEQQIYKTN